MTNKKRINIHNTDCLTMLSKIKSETVDMVFADPPFNVNYKYDGFKDKNPDYQEWCEQWIAECFRVLKPTGSFYLMTIDRHLPWKLPTMAKHGVLINIIRWKNISHLNNRRSFWNTGPSILLFGKSADYKFNRYAESRTTKRGESMILNYWEDIPKVYAGAVKHKEAILDLTKKKKAHPCQMPEMLANRAILFSTNEGDVVVDPFSGSGTTAISALKLKRRFIGSEKSSVYFQLIENRINSVRANLSKITKTNSQ